MGGELATSWNIQNLEELPKARAILFDTSPKQLLKIAGDKLDPKYKDKLERYRYGPGVFKMDWALSQPIPWKAKECLLAGTVHLGGTEEDISLSENKVWSRKYPEKNYIILAQQSLFDKTRAPANKHTAWAYCHVPNNSKKDLSNHMESLIEKYAPGFKDCILARSARTAHGFEIYNPNYVGGDIAGGVNDIWQLFARPASWINPYATSSGKIYICSASTPPGGGVHGMCGYHAAQLVLKKIFNSSYMHKVEK